MPIMQVIQQLPCGCGIFPLPGWSKYNESFDLIGETTIRCVIHYFIETRHGNACQEAWDIAILEMRNQFGLDSKDIRTWKKNVCILYSF